jgi:hypothetical protein
VKVHVVRHRRPLVRAECREFSAFIGFFRVLDILCPDRVRDLGTQQCFDLFTGQQLECIEIDPLNFFGAVVLEDQRRCRCDLVDRRCGIISQVYDSDIFGVIGNACAIERRIDLGEAVAKKPRIERPACVNVGFAK